MPKISEFAKKEREALEALKTSSWRSIAVKLGYYLYKKETSTGKGKGKDKEVEKAWNDFKEELKKLTDLDMSEEGIIDFLSYKALPPEVSSALGGASRFLKEKSGSLYATSKVLSHKIISELASTLKRAGRDVNPEALAVLGVAITVCISLSVVFFVWKSRMSGTSDKTALPGESLNEGVFGASNIKDKIGILGATRPSNPGIRATGVPSSGSAIDFLDAGIYLIFVSIALFNANRKKSEKDMKLLIGYLAVVGMALITSDLYNKGIFDKVLSAIKALAERTKGAAGAGARHWKES